jgi:hypothetical protein
VTLMLVIVMGFRVRSGKQVGNYYYT